MHSVGCEVFFWVVLEQAKDPRLQSLRNTGVIRHQMLNHRMYGHQVGGLCEVILLLFQRECIQRVEVPKPPCLHPWRRLRNGAVSIPEGTDRPSPPVPVWSGTERVGIFL